MSAATLTRDEALERVAGLPTEAKARIRWNLQRRPSQTPPDGDWLVWLILAGRGFGKTRTGAEWLAEVAYLNPGTRWAVVAPTFGDARDTCVEGESGLLHALGHEVGQWNRSLGELTLRNGSRVKLFSADEPERLRGPQHHGAWCDELAAWRYPETWDQLQFGLRLETDTVTPRSVVTTTPRPTKLVRALVDRESTHVTTGSTFENAANLAPSALDELRSLYEGTRLGRQELHAELLLDTPGALWSLEMFEADAMRCTEADVPELVRVVTAIDPAVTSGEDSDDTGIVTAGVDPAGDVWVLADDTCHLGPEGWASVAIGALDTWGGDRVIGEVNNGGDMVETVLRAVDRSVPYRKVTASRGKRVRAEPVAALYEQGQVHHVGDLSALEDQLTSWVPDGVGQRSPDRLDALVWAVTELAVKASGRRRSVVSTGRAA